MSTKERRRALKKSELRLRYARGLGDKRDKFVALKGQLVSGWQIDQTLAEVIQLAHDCAGTGGAFGFPEITRTGRTLEESARSFLDKNGPPLDPISWVLEKVLDCIQALSSATTKESLGTDTLPASECPEEDQLDKDGILYGRRILVVDDNPMMQLSLKSLLNEDGARVFLASNGTEGKEIAASVQPDLILLDITMPGMSGYDVCFELQNDPSTVLLPVIFLTAQGAKQDRSKAFSVGGVGYLVKPVERTALLSTILKHLKTGDSWKALSFTDGKVKGPKCLSTLSSLSIARFTLLRKELYLRWGLGANKAGSNLEFRPDRLFEVALSHGWSAAQVTLYLSKFTGITSLENFAGFRPVIGLLPRAYARANQVIPLLRQDGERFFVVANPFSWELIEILSSRYNLSSVCELRLASPSIINSTLSHDGQNVPIGMSSAKANYVAAGNGGSSGTGSDNSTVTVLARTLERSFIASSGLNDQPLVELQKSAPVVQLIEEILRAAYEQRASDIHIEPMENCVLVRYRVDGHLRVVHRFRPRELIQSLVARIKIMSNLDIAERRLPQDGRINYSAENLLGYEFDLRVATAPMAYGEKVVLRIIDKAKALLPLGQLGFSEANLTRYRANVQSPGGLILHVGPTGSGKSMTLYSALNEIQSSTRNIQTIEDPIEYTLHGINQLQVNPSIGLTFPRALRSLLRQDPDVILLGEIRDSETAEIALKAAQTGHLVFSTLHTNDAISTALRLTELGLEASVVSNTLVMICSQRLVRRLCLNCKRAYKPSEAEFEALGLPLHESIELFCPVGCDACAETGYRGRIGIHELLLPSAKLRQMIGYGNPSAAELKRCALKEGDMTTLYWDAMLKVIEGVAFIDDVLQVVTLDKDMIELSHEMRV